MFHKNTPRLWQVTQPVLWQSKAVTESIKSIKFLEKLTMPCNILYAWNTQISLRNFQGWNSSRAVWHFTCQPGIGTLDFYLGIYSLAQKNQQHIENSGSISTSQYCSSFQDRVTLCKVFWKLFLRLGVKAGIFHGSIFPVRKDTQSNDTFYCNFRLRSRSFW